MNALKLLALPLLLAACGGNAPAGAADSPDVSAPVTMPPGRYDIVAIDGVAPEGDGTDSGEWQRLQFAFGRRTYGGDAGCNGMGGLYVRVGDRLHTMVGPQTAMACHDARGAQEDAVHAVFWSSPTLSRDGEDVVLSGGGHTMTLRLAEATPLEDAEEQWQSPSIEGQDYVVETISSGRIPGELIWSDAPPLVSFRDGRAAIRIDCETPISAPYSEANGRIESAAFPAPCAEGVRDRQLAAILSGETRYVTGPNGELLIAGENGWATLRHRRRDRPK